MTEKANTIESLAKQVESLERAQATQLEALKLLLPMAIAIPSTSANSAVALKELSQALQNAEKMQPRSEDFWYLASAMALALSSRAVSQHPNDPEVLAIYQGLRAHKMQ